MHKEQRGRPRDRKATQKQTHLRGSCMAGLDLQGRDRLPSKWYREQWSSVWGRTEIRFLRGRRVLEYRGLGARLRAAGGGRT